MDAERRDQMTDAALDRELRAIVGVDPSPDFVARVRTRIAEQPVSARSWFGAWRLDAVAVAVAVAAVLLVAVAITHKPSRGEPVRQHADARPDVPAPASATNSARTPGAPPAGAADPHRSAENPIQSVRSEQAAPARANRTTRHVDVQAPGSFGVGDHAPEILVDPREAAALRALIAGARDGRIDLAPVVQATAPTSMELPAVAEIDIPFLIIDPIAPAAGEEGVRQ
jgi:hypothetical protein